MLTILYGQTRITFAMCRDGLMPRSLATLKRRKTPVRITLVFGLPVAALAAFVPLAEIAELVNIGTLFAFLIVNLAVIVAAPLEARHGAWVPGAVRAGLPADRRRAVHLPHDEAEFVTWQRFIAWLAPGSSSTRLRLPAFTPAPGRLAFRACRTLRTRSRRPTTTPPASRSGSCSGRAGQIPGATVAERRERAAQDPDVDFIRRLLCHEPRGHADMYGCFLVPPDDDGADLGVLFWHKDGYSTACGHGTIALGAWAVETGRVIAAPGRRDRRHDRRAVGARRRRVRTCATRAWSP